MAEANTPAMVVLRRGDRVLVAMAHEPPEDEVREYLMSLTRAFPGVEFVVAGGIAGLLVQPGDKSPENSTG